MPLTQRGPSSSAPFGAGPYQTHTPSQGSITLYQDDSCESPLSNTATPLILGQCENMPFSGVQAVSINSVPTCSNYGTPILIVSDQPDCKNSTFGTGPDSGVVGKCQAYSTGANIGSVEFICYGSGISAVSPTSTATSSGGIPAAAASSGSGGQNKHHSDDDSNSGDDSCCCCCTVM